MATRSIPASITRRLLTTSQSTRIATRPIACASPRIRSVSGSYRPALRIAGQRRPFCTTPRTRLAAVDDAFDPKSIERESDEPASNLRPRNQRGLGSAAADITPAKEDHMYFMTRDRAIPLPKPPQMNNHGNYIISLNQMVKWLGERAEEVGVEVYPGFAASEVLYNHEGVGGFQSIPKLAFPVKAATAAAGTGKGTHNAMSRKIKAQPEKFKSGLVVHSLGYPLPKDTDGGTYWLQSEDGAKLRPSFHTRLGVYGGIVYSGLEASIPKLAFPGGALLGDAAGLVNLPKHGKPDHAATKPADEYQKIEYPKATWDALQANTDGGTVFLYGYEDKMRKSPIWSELKTVRNMRPSFHTRLGVYGDEYQKIEYPKPDGKISLINCKTAAQIMRRISPAISKLATPQGGEGPKSRLSTLLAAFTARLAISKYRIRISTGKHRRAAKDV
ncbi:electron transfer flavoproteinhypothetical proteinubiquinone oxidoreductase [Bipolaris maydis]|nr:electron transfer flavoproteinhypothetical proteinubiquinone oxidoreductase [Bipolaris maydis]